MEFRDRSEFREYLMGGLGSLKLSNDTLDRLYRSVQKGADPQDLREAFLMIYRDAFSYLKPILDDVEKIKKKFPQFSE